MKDASLSRLFRLFAVAAIALAAPTGIGAAPAAPGGVDFARYGFEPAQAPAPASLEGLDLGGSPRKLDLSGEKPILIYLLRAAQSSARSTLGALEKLRADYSGRLLVAAIGPDAPSALAQVSKGLGVSYPLLSSKDAQALLGFKTASGFLIIGPGGAALARRAGAFDWSGFAARELIDRILAAYPAAAKAPPSPGASAPESSAPSAPAPSTSSAAAPGKAPSAPDASYLSEVEAAVVAELKLARTDPRGYAEYLRDYRSRIRGGVYEEPGKIGIQLQEGTRAVDEAIAFLEKAKPLKALEPSKGISRAARDHAAAQGASGATGHNGSDGSTPFQRMNRYGSWSGAAGENISYGAEGGRAVVIQLLVDDGVSSRGHRANIFNAAFARVGVGFGPHPRYGAVCVLDFAAAYEER